jgi:hypothetical protein
MPEVVLVRWPEEGTDGLMLAGRGTAVLYLVDAGGDPPVPTTCLEDWIRIPGDERDLRARVASLELRSLIHQGPPRIDETGHLHYLGRVATLADEEAQVASVLVSHFGQVVPDRELGGGRSQGRPLTSRVSGLRGRVRELGLDVRRVRRRGYVLQRR